MLKISFALYGFLLLFITNVSSASAQWVLPNNHGLLDDLDVGILRITNWLLGFTTSIAVLALIWGGLNYISSSGDAQKAELAKKIIYYAAIGLTMSGVAYAFVNLIATKLLI
ncbi:pilin [Patescibacteria group bacterium]|nr:pilin [Patescibacteria group bacterium]